VRYLRDSNDALHDQRESELDCQLRSTVKMRRSKHCHCPMIRHCLLSNSFSAGYYLERIDQRHSDNQDENIDPYRI